MAYKQHFIDWFSGKQASSYWHSGGQATSTFLGKDEVNGGMVMKSGTTGNNNAFWGFNAKNQFAHDGFVQIAVWRLDPTSTNTDYNQAQCGMASQTNDNGQNAAHWMIRRTETYIEYRTKSSGGSGVFTDTTISRDNNFHHTKMEGKTSAYSFTIDHVLQTDKTTNLPSASLSPFLKCDDSGQVPSVLGIKYMECYNT